MVSIVVPVYNGEKYLERCLESAIRQTYANIEVVCVNDGSSDSSQQILDRYSKLDKRVRVFYQLNQGVSVARNNGIKYSQGEYITFLDCDDFLNRNEIELFVNKMHDENVDVVRTRSNRLLENGDIIRKEKFSVSGLYAEDEIKHEIIPKLLDGEMSSHLTLLCIKSKVIKGNHMHLMEGIAIMEDKLFCVELFSKIKSFYQIDECTYNYYCNYSSAIMSNEKCFMRIDYIFRVAELCKDILKNNDLCSDENLKSIYTGHFAMICRELVYCKNKNSIVNHIKRYTNNHIYIQMMRVLDYADFRLDRAITLRLLKNKKYNKLRIYLRLLEIIKVLKKGRV